MFDEELEERFVKSYPQFCCNGKPLSPFWDLWKTGAELGYQKAKEDVKHDLMMKLKDEGIVKPLKDCILRNERLSSQEQLELCAWIECAMDFGENLDECAKELIKNIIRVTWGEGWNYSLDWKVKAEQFLLESN